jgi:hypothetical protein
MVFLSSASVAQSHGFISDGARSGWGEEGSSSSGQPCKMHDDSAKISKPKNVSGISPPQLHQVESWASIMAR